jgi:hypothetical protein
MWDDKIHRPIVDNKTEDPLIGATQLASKNQYCGPPGVDLVIMNLHEDSMGTYRCSRPFPMEKLLSHLKKIKVHSLNATSYCIIVVLASELMEGSEDVSDRVANDIWDMA